MHVTHLRNVGRDSYAYVLKYAIFQNILYVHSIVRICLVILSTPLSFGVHVTAKCLTKSPSPLQQLELNLVSIQF